jgi:6-pyruvoyltetrahydropterin/6-carboxytetrahydropterin synthase
MLTITKRLEFDAGHRIPNHDGLCKNVHGHRYALEISLEGKVQSATGTSSDGMLIDFSDVKRLALKHLIDRWDHSCLVFSGDALLLKALSLLPDHKTTILDAVPTVENLAALAFRTLETVYSERFGKDLRLQSVRLYETPTCWADVVRPVS